MNELLIKEAEGLDVLYGSEVCLMHVDSKSFVKANNDCAETNKLGYDCQLSNWYSMSMMFKILPRYKSRQDGEIIQYNDNILFQNIKFSTYLSFTTDLKLFHDKDYETSETNPFRIEQNVLDRFHDRHKVYLSQEPETAWRVALFRRVGCPRAAVLGNELIKLKHTEVEGYLSAGLKYKAASCEVYIRNYEGEFKTEEDSVSNLWEIEHMDLMERGREFLMEGNNSEDDMNYLKISVQFRLRHFLTGKLLQRFPMLKQDGIVLSPIVPEGFLPPRLLQTSCLSCMPILKNIEYIQADSSYYLCLDAALIDPSSAKYLKCDTNTKLEREALLTRMQNMDPEVLTYFSPLSDKDIGEIRHPVFSDREFSTEDAFIIEKVEEDRQREILLVRSCLPFFKHLAMVMRNGDKSQLKPSIFFKIEGLLFELCAFLFDLSKNTDFQITEMSGDPVPRRQQILKDMKLIDILVDTLYYPFKSKMFDITAIQSSDPIAVLLSNVYSTLRYTIQEYRPNELQASQWLGLIMDQSLKTREYNDIQASKTLTELIDNNQRILESRIKAETISQFIHSLIHVQRDAKSVKILRAICICDGKPMIKNQKETSTQLLKTTSNAKELIFPLRRFGNKIEVHILDSHNKWLEINEFKRHSETTEMGKSYNYFISSINLFADLCMDRNYLAMEPLQKIYTMEYCFDICIDKQNPEELRSAFCRLIENLWVKVHPYVDIKLPEYTKVLHDEEEDPSLTIICSSEDTTRFEGLKKFCMRYLDKAFNIPDITSEENNEKNELNFCILCLVETMLKLGFYKQIKEINILLEALKEILRSIAADEHKTNEKKFSKGFGLGDYLQTSSTVTNCRRKVCDILMLITNIKEDQEIKIFLSRLRTLALFGPEEKKIVKSPNNRSVTLVIKPRQRVAIGFTGPTNEDFPDKLKALPINNDTVEELTSNTVHASNSSIQISKEKDFVDLLVELVINDDPGLQFSALKLLHSLYTQTAILGKNVQKLQLIVTIEERAELNKGNHFAKELNKLIQSCELWFIESDFLHHQQLKTLLNDAIYKLMPEGYNRDVHAEPEAELWVNGKTNSQPRQVAVNGSSSARKTSLDKLTSLIMQTSLSMPNDFYKELSRNLGVVSSLLQLLKFYYESGELENSKPHAEPILIALNLLWLLVKNNQRNKLAFTSEFVKETLMKYLQNDINGIDYTAYFLLKELFTDNEEGVAQDSALNLLCISTIIKNMEALAWTDIRKSIYMDILAHIVSKRGSIAKQNQNLVIKRISDDHSNQIFMDSRTMKETINTFQKEYELDRTSFISKFDLKTGLFKPPTGVAYLNSFVNVLTLCGKGKNAFAETIGQKFLPLSEIVSILEVRELHILAKLTFMNFCFHMYLDTEKQIMVYNHEHLLKIWDLYVGDFIDLTSDQSSLQKQVAGLALFTPDKIISADDCLCSLAEVLVLSLENIINRKLLTTNNIDLQKASELSTACLNLGKSSTFRSIEPLYSRLGLRVAALSEELKESLDGVSSGIKKPNLLSPKAKNFPKGVKNTPDLAKRSQEAIGSGVLPILDKTQETHNKQLSFEIRGSKHLLNERYNQFCTNFVSSQHFLHECDEEFENLISSITLLDSSLGASSKELKFQIFCKSLLKYLAPDNENMSEEIQLMGLRICRKFVESAVPDTTVPGADWTLSMYSSHINELKRKQKKMEDLGIFTLVGKLLRADCGENMKMETVLLSISLLLGGCLSGQMAMHAELLKDRDNRMMASLKDLIMRNFEVVKYKMITINDMELDSKINSKVEFDALKILQSDSEFRFSLSLCTRIYRLLQLLCEGHNITLQNFLRKQSDPDVIISSKDINFIGDTCFMLGPFFKFCNIHTEDLGEQIFDFLIEAVQGPCEGNQKKLFNSKFIDFGNDFLNDQYVEVDDFKNITDFTDEKRMISIVKKVIKLMLSLFEGYDGNELFATHISRINFDHLISYLTEELIRYFYNTYNVDIRQINSQNLGFLTSYIKDMVFEDDLVDAFEIYFFINTINDLSGVYTNRIRSLKGVKKLAFDFFRTFSDHIEIVFMNNLQRVYFIIHPACRYLSDIKKSDFMNSVNRDTPNDKLTGMMDAATELSDIMDHLCSLSNGRIKISPKILDTLRFISLCVSFSINLIIFIFFKKKVIYSKSYISEDFNENHIAMRILGLTQVICGVLLLIIWGIIEGPMVVMNGFRKKFIEYRAVIF